MRGGLLALLPARCKMPDEKYYCRPSPPNFVVGWAGQRTPVPYRQYTEPYQ